MRVRWWRRCTPADRFPRRRATGEQGVTDREGRAEAGTGTSGSRPLPGASRAIDAPVAYAGQRARRFRDLPPLDGDDAALLTLGGVGGACDGAATTTTTTTTTDAAGPAVWPFFGQFVARDITADRSALATRSNPEDVRNFRTLRANLECHYRARPISSPCAWRERREDTRFPGCTATT